MHCNQQKHNDMKSMTTILSQSILIFSLLFGFLPAYANAQQEIKDTASLSSALGDLFQSLDRKEIRVEGAIGVFVAEVLYFADSTGRYEVELDAGRDIRRQIEGCKLNMFSLEKSPCFVTGMAEISIDLEDDNLGDGTTIKLILYQVDSFENREG